MDGLATGILIGVFAMLVIAVVVVRALFDLAGEDPPAEPTDMPYEAALAHDAFFHMLTHGRGVEPDPAGAAGYQRPLDIEAVPDDHVMAPPRQVRGINNEA